MLHIDSGPSMLSRRGTLHSVTLRARMKESDYPEKGSSATLKHESWNPTLRESVKMGMFLWIQARNKPLSTILEPISFTRLTVVKGMRLKQGVRKTRQKHILRPEPGKSPIIPARQKATTQKEGTSTAFQDVRAKYSSA